MRRTRGISLLLLFAPTVAVGRGADEFAAMHRRVQDAIVKVYGAGSVSGLEGYQSGFFVRSSPPQVLTVDSTVLEGGTALLIDADGDRFEGRVAGRDAETGLALLHCPETVEPPGVLSASDTDEPAAASQVWVFSNAFGIAAGDEPVSLQRGRLVARTVIDGGAGSRPTRAQLGVPSAGTEVLVLSAVTSNPGSAGGAVVSSAGRLLGVVGAEYRWPQTGLWLNYALPAPSLEGALRRMEAGDVTPIDEGLATQRTRQVMRRIGLGLLPSAVPRPPAYVESVSAGSAAERSGLAPNDLFVAINGVTVGDAPSAADALARAYRRADWVEVTVLRGESLETLRLEGEDSR